jgi:hypothetical protein
MSLATGGMGMSGGGAGGGMAMAHSAGNAVGRAGPPPPQASSTFGAPPPSAAFLGVDLLDKQQGITLKQVKNTSHLPIVAIDLYASEPHVAMFPPKPEDPSDGTPPVLIGKMRSNVAFQSTENAQKTLRKWLAKQKTFTSLQADALAKTSDDPNAVVIEKPQRWLGLRRLEDTPEFIRSRVATKEGTTPAISEEESQEVGVTMINSTLDGSQPQGDDFDRVVCNVRVHSSKKALTLLPEEATQILINQAQIHVANKTKAEDEEEITDFPCAVAVPAFACHDAAAEALYEATGSSGVFFQRSLCALAGALLPGPEGKPNPLLDRLNTVRTAMLKEFQVEKSKDPDATFDEDVLVILLGMTDDGFECTAVHVSSLQLNNMSCLYGNFKVLSNVSYQAANPLVKTKQCCEEVEAAIEKMAPEADGPAAIVTYGSNAEQVSIGGNWNTIKLKLKEWAEVPIIKTKTDCVAMGTAVLGAVSHGRLSVLVDAGAKKKAELGIRVQNVAPVAVGVQMNYSGGAAKKWEPVKVIFDFDRRVPAGPYPIDLKAADCVVHKSGVSADTDEEAFIKASKEAEGSRGIPKREKAALDLKIQIVQKWTRDGEWVKVGDAIEPLVKLEGSGDDEKRVACERVSLELGLGITGMITTNLVGER